MVAGALFAITSKAQIPTQYLSYSALDKITSTRDFFFFVLNDDQHGVELWRSDGSTSGTHIVKDINPGARSSSPNHFVLLDSILFFTADDGVHHEELWRSDGTSEGTYLVKDIFSGSTTINSIGVWGSDLIIHSEDDSGISLWRSDGTSSGTMVITESFFEDTAFDLNVNNILYRQKKHFMLKPLDENFCRLDNITFFVAKDEITGSELWRTDGTHSGTSLVKDICYGVNSSQITAISSVTGLIYFSGNDGHTGSELWKSDGTAAGTMLVKDIMPGADSSLPRNFTAFGDKVVFSVFGTDGIELWISDGSSIGTTKVFPVTTITSTALLGQPLNDANASVVQIVDDGLQ